MGERMAAMESFIRSASEGPPKRALRASGLMGRAEGGSALGEVDGVSEFSMLHFRILFMPGSMATRGKSRVVESSEFCQPYAFKKSPVNRKLVSIDWCNRT